MTWCAASPVLQDGEDVNDRTVRTLSAIAITTRMP